MKLALVWSGHQRTLITCLNSWKEYFISVYHPDIYINLWDGDSAEISKLLSPIKIVTDQELEAVKLLDETCDGWNEQLYPATIINKWYQIDYKRFRAVNMVDKEYDFIIVSRPDVQLYNCPVLKHITKSSFYHIGLQWDGFDGGAGKEFFNDYFMIASPALMKRVMFLFFMGRHDLVDQIVQGNPLTVSDPVYNPHHYWWRIIKKYNISLKEIEPKIKIGVIRK